MKVRNVRVAIIITAIALCLYLLGASHHLKYVNTDMTATDQSAYMDFAKKMHETNYKFSGVRNRMPMYPFIQAIFYRQGMSDQDFFTQGKYINIILSILILFCIFFIFKKYFSLFYSINLTLIAMFSVFMFKAAYFQCELLFYLLNFLSFLLMCRMLIKPTLKTGVITGVVVGLAYLTKASILAGFILFLLFSAGKSINMAVQKKVFSRLLYIVPVVLAFAMIVYPYVRESKRIYGRYFYNVNTTFYMWYDSWNEAKEGTIAHGDQLLGPPKMPAELLPSPSKYLKEHNPKQICVRMARGLWILLRAVYFSYGYLKYIVIYFSFLIFLALITGRSRYIPNRYAGYGFPAIFCLLYFVAHLILYAWYTPICDGERLILSQFLPFIFIVSIAIKEYSKDVFITFRDFKIAILPVYNLLILYIFAMDLSSLMYRVFTMYSGN